MSDSASNTYVVGRRAPIVVALFVILVAVGAFMLGRKNRVEVPETRDSQQTEHADVATESLVIPLIMLQGSGMTGFATLDWLGGVTRVTIRLSGGIPGMHPAHIHTGTCEILGPVLYPLSDVQGGVSTSVITVSQEDLMNSLPIAINIHKSQSELSSHVLCGDITVSKGDKIPTHFEAGEDYPAGGAPEF